MSVRAQAGSGLPLPDEAVRCIPVQGHQPWGEGIAERTLHGVDLHPLHDLRPSVRRVSGVAEHDEVFARETNGSPQPKHAGRPIWSYRLSIIAFWAFTYSYIWAGPHHLHYSAIPEWVQSLGMVMSIILLAPSWATMVNGVMTVAGAWEKLKTDPALKFIVLALAFYGLATFEGPMMAIKSVNVVSHFTDWTIGHVHSGALGWNAMITFGTFYFLVPRLFGTELYSVKLANIHFWLALAGTMLYVLAMWGAGVSQGLLWLSLDRLGELSYGFRDIMASMVPYYALRVVAGAIFLAGAILMFYNFVKTAQDRSTVARRIPDVTYARTSAQAAG